MPVNEREVRYLKAFDHCIRPRFRMLDHVERARGNRRRGDLDPDTGCHSGIYDTHNYQRSHADAFVAASQAVGLSPPTGRTTVIDLGAGATTVAIALAELWGDQVRNVDYLGIEPDTTMRELGSCMLGSLNDPWRSASIQPSSEPFSATGQSRVLITLSYLVHQSSITSSDITEWAGLASVCARTCETGMLITTINLTTEEFRRRDATDRLLRALWARDLTVLGQDMTIRVENRFPMDNGTWNVVPPGQTPGYQNVVVRHWNIGTDG